MGNREPGRPHLIVNQSLRLRSLEPKYDIRPYESGITYKGNL